MKVMTPSSPSFSNIVDDGIQCTVQAALDVDRAGRC
jgi:hypothetical protein